MRKLLLFFGIGCLCLALAALFVPSQPPGAGTSMACISLVMGLVCLIVSLRMKRTEERQERRFDRMDPERMDEQDNASLKQRQAQNQQMAQKKMQWILMAIGGFAFLGLALLALSNPQSRGSGIVLVCIGLVMLFFAWRLRSAVMRQEEQAAIEQTVRRHRNQGWVTKWQELLSRKPSEPTDIQVTEMTVREYCRLLEKRGGFDAYYVRVDGVLYHFNQAIRRSEYITGTRDADADVNDIDELIQYLDEVQVQHSFETIQAAQYQKQQDPRGEMRYTLQVTFNACGGEIEHVPDDGKIRVTEKRYRLAPPSP